MWLSKLTSIIVALATALVCNGCHNNADCGRRKYCDGGNIFRSGRCVDLLSDGESCLNSILKPFGDGNSCKSKSCNCGTCGKKLANGKHCTTDGDCLSGLCGPMFSLFCTGTCRNTKRNYQECDLEFLDKGLKDDCQSGLCEAVSFTKAICSPKNGFKEGTQCNQDSDCDKTKPLWCKGGAFYATGRCTKCPKYCPNGCNAIFNTKLECGRKDFFQRIAEEIKEVGEGLGHFFACLVPNVVKDCISDAISSGKGCFNVKKPCVIKLGGLKSSCLKLKEIVLPFHFEHSVVVMSGLVRSNLQSSLQFNVKKGQIMLDLQGTFGIKANFAFSSFQAYHLPLLSRRLYLTNWEGSKFKICKHPYKSILCMPGNIYKQLLIIGYMPIIVEIRVQLVAFLDIKLSTTKPFNGSVSFNEEIKLRRARATFDVTKGISLQTDFHSDFGKSLTEKFIVGDGIDLLAVIRIGPEITVSINGLPISILPMVRIAVDGIISRDVDEKSSNCIQGMFKVGVGLDAAVGIDSREFTPARFLGIACSGVSSIMCVMEKAVKCMARVLKAGKARFNPCKKTKEFCSNLERKVNKFLPYDFGKSFFGTNNIVKAKIFQSTPNGKQFCQHLGSFVDRSSKIGVGVLHGGGKTANSKRQISKGGGKTPNSKRQISKGHSLPFKFNNLVLMAFAMVTALKFVHFI